MAYKLTTNKTWSETKNELVDCLRKWGVAGFDLECDARITASWNQSPEQRTVKLRLTWKDGREIFWQYNLQDRAVDNLRVLYLAADAMRLNEARGIDDLLRQAYMALPAPVVQRDHTSCWASAQTPRLRTSRLCTAPRPSARIQTPAAQPRR